MIYKIRKSLSLLFLILFVVSLPSGILVQPVSAIEPETAVVGMPFQGRWAYNIVTTAACGVTSHPSCHEIYSGDWSTDLHAPSGTEVRLKVTSQTGALSFAWETATGSCGTSRRVKVYVDGTYIGRVSFAHLSNAASTSTAPTNGMVVGKIENIAAIMGCSSVNHVHIEVDNASSTTHACYQNHSTPSHTAGQVLSEGAILGIIGSNNTGTKQACGTGGGGSSTHYSDYTIYRYDPATSTGLWYAKSSSHLDPTPVWGWAHGSAGDKPIAADFDGDGYDDYGIYRVMNGTGYWYVRSGGSGEQILSAWGVAHGGWNQDIPIAGDFDGDGKADFGIYRMESDSTGRWYVRSSKSGNPPTPVWGWAHGSPGDIPVVGDFNGDNVDDYGIYRLNAGTSTGYWYIRSGGDGLPTPIWDAPHGGWPGDQPVVGDFNGDNIDDFGIYRVVNGTGYWYVKSGADGQPIPAAWGVPHGGWGQDIALGGDFGGN